MRASDKIRRCCLFAVLLIGTGGLASPTAVGAFGMPDSEPPAPSQQASSKQAAIVIDDFGNDMEGTEQMMELHIPFTAAVMPFLSTTKRDAEWAHRLGHDVIVHLPMEPKRGPKSWLGPGAITTDLPDQEIRRRVEAAIADVPFAVGVNNHMGSKATGDERVMRIVLQVCKEKGMFFLDSKTNYRSVAGRIAAELGVPTADNHLFFDDVTTVRHIAKQVELMERHLDEHDVCVGIGHVGSGGKKTAAVLKQYETELAEHARLVGLSTLLKVPLPAPLLPLSTAEPSPSPNTP